MKELEILSEFDKLDYMQINKSDDEELWITVHTYYDGSYTSYYEDCLNIPEDKIIQIREYSQYKMIAYDDIMDFEYGFEEIS